MNAEKNKMVLRIAGIAICLASIFTRSGAQELGIELNGGLQGMRYPLHNGQVNPLPGGSLGLSCTFRLDNRFNLRSGISGGIYRTQASLHNGVYSSDQVDDAGSAFEYRVKTEGYKETQRFIAAEIPLLFQYHTAGRNEWYFEGGGKILVPFAGSAQASAQQLILSGYYPDYKVEVSNLPQHGFGTLNNWKGSSTFKLRPAAVLSAGTGYSFMLASGKRLYAGLFVDYGLSNLKESNDSLPLLTYSPTGIKGARPNGVLNMQNAGQSTLLSFGLQLRLAFGSGKAKPAAPAKKPAPSKKHLVPQKKSAPPPKIPVAQPTAPVPPAIEPVAPPPGVIQEPQQPEASAISDDDAAVIRKPVIFGTIGEISIPESEQLQLDAVADILKKYPHIRLSIVGHFCNGPTDMETENRQVGLARAKAVAQYLRGKGIDRRRLDFSSFSESDPVQPTDPAANYRSRRVVILVE